MQAGQPNRHAQADPPRWVMLGASGRVGRMLMRAWRNDPPQDMQIVPQFRDRPGHPDSLDWAPLAGAGPLRRWVGEKGAIAGMFLFAGVTPRSHGALTDNAALAEAALAAAQAVGIPRVIVASSAAVYGTAKPADWCETDDPAPEGGYGQAKLATEETCRAWRARGLDVCCLRIGNVAGADAALLNVAGACAEQPIRLHRFADGQGPVRSYIGVASLAQVLESLACHDAPLPPVLNVAAPVPVAMESLLRAANAPFRFVPAPHDAVARVTLDCTRLGAFHAFAADAGTPKAMVEQWQRVRDPR